MVRAAWIFASYIALLVLQVGILGGCVIPPASVPDAEAGAVPEAGASPHDRMLPPDGRPGPDAQSPRSDAGQLAWFRRQHPAHLRLVSYNILKDSVFKGGSKQAQRFARLVKALDADVWALQEVYKTDTSQVAALFDKLVPLAVGQRWQARSGGDNMTVSRYPIKLHHSQTTPSCGRRVSLDLIDLPDSKHKADIYLLNNHFTCCGGTVRDATRQLEADQLVAWIRDARTPGGSINLPQGTPMVVLGDLNIVGGPQPLNTLITGDIYNENLFGTDSPPDWDGTALTDAHPLHNSSGAADYTWRWDGSGYKPGRLDYVIYTDSVAQAGARFVLNTVTMTSQQLASAGLQAEDVLDFKASSGELAFDHLPVVVDLQVK